MLHSMDAESLKIQDHSPIQEFFKGKNVFITGGTGFMGRIIMEKLLRSCSDIGNIYLLVRSKKGKDCNSRIEEIFNEPIFAQIKKEQPKFHQKVFVVPGDCSQPGLGLDTADRSLLAQEVEIVFHAAATVRFDEKLNKAVAINVSGTKNILELCKEIRKLKAVVYLSTAYCQCLRTDIEEKFYPTSYNVKQICTLTENIDEELLDIITPKLLDKWPNTYTLTKALAEDLIREESEGLPLALFRPAIVAAAYKEPVKGWIDNLYGPTGVVAGAFSGLLRTVHADSNCHANIVPVDMAVNAAIVAAWDVAENKRPSKEIPIYNYVSTVDNPITWGEFNRYLEEAGLEIPTIKAVWFYTFETHKHWCVHYLAVMLLHFFPALLVDGAALISGKKPGLVKIYQKVNHFCNVISYFSTRTWNFRNDNVKSLWDSLHTKDKELFFFNIAELKWKEYFKNYLYGVREFVLKDDISTLQQAVVRWRRLYWIHNCLKAVLAFFGFKLIWNLFSAMYSFMM